jgi:hypothetical protein
LAALRFGDRFTAWHLLFECYASTAKDFHCVAKALVFAAPEINDWCERAPSEE